jgi:Fanconi anemia group M protein
MPYDTLKTIKPRKYQRKIFDTCRNKNCLVVLPTGTGKTLIALMLSIYRLKQFPQSKIVFLAPTRPLAEQHFNYFSKHLPELFATKELFTGKINAKKRRKLWQNAEIIFSTPQCVANDLKNKLYDLEDVSLLVIDECHRCLKNYAYTTVTKIYKHQSQNQRILGLTASPGANKQKIQRISNNLDIEAIEARTRQSVDVKPYLQELKFQIIKLDFPSEFQEIKELIKKIYDKKVKELKNRKLLFTRATKTNLIQLQKQLMKRIANGDRHFNNMAGASACAQAIKLQHSLELLETQTLESFQTYLKELFKQAQQGKSKAVKQLIKKPEFNQAYVKTTELIARKTENPKLSKLKQIIEKEFQNKSKRIIVFAQFRDTVTKICKQLNTLNKVNARVFVGQAKKQDKKGLSQKEQQALIKEFTLGKVNVLVSTSIGEEGLDIPEVSAVIFYEPIPSAIRQIQRRGRTARLKPGKLLILMVKKTRDESYYWAAFHKEKKMHKALNGMKDKLENRKQKPEEKEQKKLFENE